MKNTKPLLVLLAFVAACSSNSSAQDGAIPDADFGSRIAGSFFLDVAHEGFPDVPALITLTRDGGFQSSDASDFGARDLSTIQSPVYGSWKRNGELGLKVRTLYFGYDDTGEPVAIGRTTGTFDFEADLATGTGTLLVQLFDPTQDPLEESAEPFNTLNATLTARRIVVP